MIELAAFAIGLVTGMAVVLVLALVINVVSKYGEREER